MLTMTVRENIYRKATTSKVVTSLVAKPKYDDEGWTSALKRFIGG